MRRPSEFENHPLPYDMARSTSGFRGFCKYVTDGDTYDVFIDLGMNQYAYDTIRLHGLDTAEIFHPRSEAERTHGLAAKARAEELILNKPVLIKSYKDAETFGRYVADVALVTVDPLTLTDIAGTLQSEGYAKKASYS